MNLKNDYVTHDELLKYQFKLVPEGKGEISIFLGKLVNQICEECGCKATQVELDIEEDKTSDPENLAQRYCVIVKDSPDNVKQFLEETGPYNLYVQS